LLILWQTGDMEELFKEIKHKKWFFGIRAEESLFFYSAKYFNREAFTNKYYKSGFVETLLFPLKNDYPVRVFNLEQAKAFHQESLQKALANPAIILEFIEQDKKVWQQIEKLSQELETQIKAHDYETSIKLFQDLVAQYGQYGALFFINFSLGKEMTFNQAKFKTDITQILQKHNQWRNSVAFSEEKLGQVFYDFFELLVNVRKIKVTPLEIMKYLTVWEVLDFLADKLSNDDLENIIQMRQKNGYVFACLRNKRCQGALDDKKIIKQIETHFSDTLKQEQQIKILKGMSAFIVKNKIEGEVLVIKDKNELAANKIDLHNKILVAIQTTPHFIPYLKGVKAIITDEGGVTCHAAIVSREMKIPCIVGTKKATEVLKNGDTVELNTQKGIIKKI